MSTKFTKACLTNLISGSICVLSLLFSFYAYAGTKTAYPPDSAISVAESTVPLLWEANVRKWLSILIGGLLALGLTGPASALTLNVVDHGNYGFGAFGLLFDGTNVWVSEGVGGNVIAQINQNAAGMPLTGVTRTLSGPGCCGAMGWDGTHFVSSSGSVIGFFDATTGATAGSITTAVSGGLNDGLDFDHGEVWFGPDVGNKFRVNGTTGAFVGPQPVTTGGGGFSGIERIDAAGNTFLIVVNDASSPRLLCKTDLVGNFTAATDCASLPNQRYEDLAFDGRFLYAADVFGNRVDKIDLAIDGGSIFVPSGPGGVPEPGTLLLVGLGLVTLAGLRRRSRK